mgnify:CR=1 FL=1
MDSLESALEWGKSNGAVVASEMDVVADEYEFAAVASAEAAVVAYFADADEASLEHDDAQSDYPVHHSILEGCVESQGHFSSNHTQFHVEVMVVGYYSCCKSSFVLLSFLV